MPISIPERLERSPATSKELQAATGLSQSGVSRQIRRMKDTVIALRSGRSVCYALVCAAFGAGNRLPLYRIDLRGNDIVVAWVRPLAHGGFFVEPATGMPPVLLGENREGVFEDLPYFLDDLRPQGFLGREIAREIAARAPEFSPDPRYWSSDHVGRYLVSNGDDLPGNFKFGQSAHLRVRRRPEPVTADDYPTLADAVLDGRIPGSSAGGEQAKFTAYNGRRGHVIVKFSPAGDDSVARRWRDILITEYHAARTLREFELPAADTRLIERQGRLFLESQRFDRSGEYGRMSMLSLQAVDAEFTGLGAHWPKVMNALYGLDLVSAVHVSDAGALWYFGRLIHNTDMHLGNLSLAIDEATFRLLPAYDMCSMGWAPRGGELPALDFSPPAIADVVGVTPKASKLVRRIAHGFWYSVATDERISDQLQKYFLGRGNPINDGEVDD